MAIKFFASNRLEGLSSDTKPTNVFSGSIFYETDTKESYVFDGSAWSKESVGAVVSASEISDASIPFSKIANGTPNRSLGFNNSGVITELTSSSGVDPSSTVEVMPLSTDMYRDWERPIWIEGGLDPDTSKTPRQRWHFVNHGITPTVEDDFSLTSIPQSAGAPASWKHVGSYAYISQESLTLHTDSTSASSLDLWKYIGTSTAPLPLSTDQWTLRFNFEWTDFATVTSSRGIICFGLSSKDADTKYNSNQAFIGYQIYGSSSTATNFENFWGFNRGDQTPATARQNSHAYNLGDISFCEIVRHGDNFFFRLYADKHFRRCVLEWNTGNNSANRYFNNESYNPNTSSSTEAFRYLKVMGTSDTNQPLWIRGRVDNVVFWNDYASGVSKEHNMSIKTINKGAQNYLAQGRPRWANSKSCKINDVVLNASSSSSTVGEAGSPSNNQSTTITATNKWMNAWNNNDVCTWDWGADSNDTNGAGQFTTNSNAPFSINDTGAGTYGIGFQIISYQHPLLMNQFREGIEAGFGGMSELDPYTDGSGNYGWTGDNRHGTRANDSGSPLVVTDSQNANGTHNYGWGLPIDKLSVYLWKQGSPTGNLVLRVWNARTSSGSGNSRFDQETANGSNFRACSRNVISASSLSSDSTSPTKCTFDMGAYCPRIFDFFTVEFESNHSTREPNPDIPPRYRSTNAVVTQNAVTEFVDSTNKIHIQMRKLTNDDIQSAVYRYSTNPSWTRHSHHSVLWEATFHTLIKTKSYENPYLDLWCGLRFQGEREHYVVGDYRLFRYSHSQGKTFNMNTTGNQMGTETNPTYHWTRSTANLTANTFLMTWMPDYTGIAHGTYSGMTGHSREDTISASPAYRQMEFDTNAFRTVTLAMKGDHEIWVSELNQGDPKSAGATARDNPLNDWKRVGWGNGPYFQINEKFRIMRMYPTVRHKMLTANPQTNRVENSYIWYTHNSDELRVPVIGVALKPNPSMTETQFQIQVSTPDASDNAVNKWTTVRTISVSSLTMSEYNRILVPVSYTNRIRIKGSSSGSKILAFDGIKLQYASSDQVRQKHGHIVMSSSDPAVPLLGS